LYILDDFGFGKRGTFYLSENKNFYGASVVGCATGIFHNISKVWSLREPLCNKGSLFLLQAKGCKNMKDYFFNQSFDADSCLCSRTTYIREARGS